MLQVAQIDEVLSSMRTLAESVAENVIEIDRKNQIKKKYASASQLGDSRNDDPSVITDRVRSLQAKFRQGIDIDGSVIRLEDGSTQTDFWKQISMMDELDQNLKIILRDMMGSLSVEDVVGQRLLHVRNGLERCAKILSEFNGDPNDFKNLSDTDIQNFLSQLVSSFTMEDEKQVWKAIFER